MENYFEYLENFLQQLVKFAIKEEKNYTKGVRVNLFAKGHGLVHLEFTGGGSYTTSKYGWNKKNMITASTGHHHSSIGELVNKLQREKFEKLTISSIEYFEIPQE